MDFVEIKLTDGNIKNNHLYLASVLGFFPNFLSVAKTSGMKHSISRFTLVWGNRCLLTSRGTKKSLGNETGLAISSELTS